MYSPEQVNYQNALHLGLSVRGDLKIPNAVLTLKQVQRSSACTKSRNDNTTVVRKRERTLRLEPMSATSTQTECAIRAGAIGTVAATRPTTCKVMTVVEIISFTIVIYSLFLL